MTVNTRIMKKRSMGALHLTKKTISKLDSQLARGGNTTITTGEEGTSIWHFCEVGPTDISCGPNGCPSLNCPTYSQDGLCVTAGCI